MRRLFYAMLSLLCAAGLARAAPASSMSADEAYARAVTYFEIKFTKMQADQEIATIQLASAQQELKRLRAAQSTDAIAKSALTSFANGNGEAGVDALFAQAQAKAAASAEDFRRVGALAFAVDTNKAVAAYEAVLRLAPDDEDTAQNLAWLYLRSGRLDDVMRMAEQLIASASPFMRSKGFLRRGDVADTRGDLAAAERDYQSALQVATQAKLKDREAAALGNLGTIAYSRGDLAAAEAYQQRALALDEQLGRKEGMANALGNLGNIAKSRGDLAAADDYQKRSLALNEQLGRKQGIADSLGNLGVIEYKRGQRQDACGLWSRSLEIYKQIGAEKGANAKIFAGNLQNFCAP